MMAAAMVCVCVLSFIVVVGVDERTCTLCHGQQTKIFCDCVQLSSYDYFAVNCDIFAWMDAFVLLLKLV